MKALHFDGRRLELRTDRPVPNPPPGEALIRPLRMGVCATDLEIVRGMQGFTGILGHEFVGVVEAIGASTEVANGGQECLPHGRHGPIVPADLIDKRVVGTINAACGACDMCRARIPEHCRARTVLGIVRRDGCFADCFLLPIENLLLVPDSISDDQAVFTEPLAAALRILEQIDVSQLSNVTILGDGRLGLLCAQVLHRAGAPVRSVGRTPEKWTPCDKWGIPRSIVSDTPLKNDQDLVVDCTGSAAGFDIALQMVKPRGKIVLKTTVAPGPIPKPIDLTRVVVDEVDVIGSRCGPFDKALSELARPETDVLSLITHRFDLSSGPEAMRIASQPGSLKVLLEP